MHSELHDKPLGTDQVSSIKIDDSISDFEWNLIQVAVGYGLLHPNIGTNNTDEMPWRSGTYHLSYSLAPHFLLFPRKGKAVNLKTIINMNGKNRINFRTATQNKTLEQLSLFKKGEES